MALKETYPVDIDPGQIVRWLSAEAQAKPSEFRITGWRTTEVRDIPMRSDIRLGDQEREDLSEAVTIATLEIAPAHASDGWQLTVIVEDEIGPRAQFESESAGEERQIDLKTFYNEFIRPGRGSASVTAEVNGPVARARMTRLLNAIEQNRHGRDRPPPSR